jgi:hypothetical protein
MIKLSKNWEFNVLGIDNFNIQGKLTPYYDFIRKNHELIEGDICEVGVYRGFSLLATAMLLKQLGSNKIVWGFDSFEGFPEYHDNDSLEKFEELYLKGLISEEHYQDCKLNQKYKEFVLKKNVDVKNISTSGDFSNNSLKNLEEKINYLELDNIKLIKGNFTDTMNDNLIENKDINFFAGLIDCDLYKGYQVSLPFIYKRLKLGSYVFLDEYYSLKFPGAKIATDEFFALKSEKPFMHNKLSGDFERWGFIKA